MHTHRRARPALGTLVHLEAHAADAATAAEAVTAAQAAIERVEQTLSYHRPDSELNQLHRYAARQPQTVSASTWTLLHHARELAEASAGCFDPSSIGALVRHGLRPPPPVHSALPDPHANWQDLELLPQQQVRFRRPLWLDLGGIAKGYAVDCAISAMQEVGAVGGCVNAGGDLRHFGDHLLPLHVRHPANPAQLIPLGQLGASAAATSAPGWQHSDGPRQGQAVSPLFDPQRGQPQLDSPSVTVLADHCWLADGLTKVVALQGSAAADVLAHYGAEAALFDHSGNITTSPGFWPRLGHPQPPAPPGSTP